MGTKMKRKIIYLAAEAGILIILAGARLYQNSLSGSSGYLGKEIVFYEGTQALGKETTDVKEENQETGSSKNPDSRDRTLHKKKENKKAYPQIFSAGEVKLYSNGTAVLNDTAYEVYNYVDSTADQYAEAVNQFTKKLDSSVKIYNMVVPTSVGITFPDNKKEEMHSSPQKQALKKIKKKLSGRQIFVPLYDIMMQHRAEYIYFRTDHHWTQLGAYYAYQAFCSAKGIRANSVNSYKTQSLYGFYGSFYKDSGKNPALRGDTLEVFYPRGKHISMQYTTTSGEKIKAPVISDATDYGAGLKYSAFISGDHPYTLIRNANIKDHSSCVVVKESYGNAFVPFLADHYQTVHVLDYRYWEGDLTDFVRQKKAEDVIFINNISMTRSAYLTGKLLGCIV